MRVFVSTALFLQLARQSQADLVYEWPSESTPTTSLASCSGTITILAGVSTYERAQVICEADGATVCDGVMYLSIASLWYKCSDVTSAIASTFVGYVPTIISIVLDEVGWSWRPRPKSALSSTAHVVAQQSFCDGQYQGNECIEKVCAFGLSASVSPYLSAANSDDLVDNLWAPGFNGYTSDSYNGGTRDLTDAGVHAYTECSSRGVCNRLTGICDCFAGYSGKGCRRTACPNDCSGHGICSRNVDANYEYSLAGAPKAYFSSQYWDEETTMRCQCDRGYEGPDCSDRICPHGDDVLTTCAADSNHDTQVIAFSDPGSVWAAQQASNGEPLFYTLTFQDHFGGVYTTRPLVFTSNEYRNALDAQSALEALPNSAIPSVQVNSDASALTVSVSFTDAATSGKQETLTVNVIPSTERCAEGGHMPLYQNDVNLDSVTATVSHQELADIDSAFEENAPCGNRGICDRSVGKCNCFDGHTGEACNIQSVFV